MSPTSRNPYVGPRAFASDESELFFGRDREARQLYNLLLAERILLLYSPSGAGKSSLIQAKLILRLREEGYRVTPVLRVNEPLPKEAPTGNRYVFSLLSALETAWPEAERLKPGDLAGLTVDDYLKRREGLRPSVPAAGAAAQPEPAPGEVWIFDQFEEILTINPADLEAKKAFFTQVGVALRDSQRWALFAMREDYLAGLDPYLLLLPTRLKSTFRLDLLGVDAAQKAIQEPAQTQGVAFTEKAAQKLVDDLRQMQVQQPDGKMGTQLGPYVEPVQLQVVCYRLWETEAPRDGKITEDEIVSLGDVGRSLAEYYAASVAAVARETGAEERTIRDWFENSLITEQGIRDQVVMDVEASAGLKMAAIWKLVDAHLVRSEKRAGATWFELSHDRLIEPVRSNNAAWREKNLRSWQHRAVQWKREGRPPGLLLPAEALAEVTPAAGKLTPTEQEFLAAGQEALQAQQRANLWELGWGVIFAHDADPAIRDALAELLEHRRAQAGRKRPDYYREFMGLEGYRPGETAAAFLRRQGVRAGLPQTEKMPYYLLIVGDPATIPFEFQYSLAAQYAVGRIYFETLDEYANYARSVVTVERQGLALPRAAAIFSPAHDPPTTLSVEQLAQPLVDFLEGAQKGWQVHAVFKEGATKARLAQLLGGAETPAVLLTVGHGLAFPKGDHRQLAGQGALVCQDWPGPQEWRQPIPPDFYFAAGDVPDNARLLGLVAFFFAEYGAGTPQLDNFYAQAFRESAQSIAPHAFLARLPQRLLGHPQGGALAVIGHVERTWAYSFSEYDKNLKKWIGEISHFKELLLRLLQGHTVGSALEPFNQRYTNLAFQLSEELQKVHFLKQAPDELELARLVTVTADARNYVILGDPAVRLSVQAADSPAAARPMITPPVAVWQQTPRFVFNGLNGASGDYGLPALSGPQLARLAQGNPDETKALSTYILSQVNLT